MVAQSIGKQALLLPIDPNQQCHNQTDATTVHVLQAAEIEQNGACGRCAGGGIGVCKQRFREGSKLTLNIDNAGYPIDRADMYGDVLLWHGLPCLLSCLTTRFSTLFKQKMMRLNVYWYWFQIRSAWRSNLL